MNLKRWAAEFMDQENCRSCKGNRLNDQALNFKIDEKSIADLGLMDLSELYQWTRNLPKKLSSNEMKIGEEIIKEFINPLEMVATLEAEEIHPDPMPATRTATIISDY